MEKLDALASVVRLSGSVVRILGQNPGKFTLQGTNTYLVGEKPPYTLIDTGEGRPSYIPLLESALQRGAPDARETPLKQYVSDIIISHWHLDHVDGLHSVLSLLKNLWEALDAPLPFQPPRVHKFPYTTPLDPHFLRVVQSIQPGMYTPSPNGTPFHDLRDGQTFPISVSGTSPERDATFKVIHTPGHTEDSVALFFPSEGVLYTADTVLGQGTAVFDDLGTYSSTLSSLLSYTDKNTALWPGHGPVVHDGERVIKAYIAHRKERETQILQVLQQAPEDGSGTWSTWGIVAKIYASYPRELWEAAVGSVNQHLQKLVAEGRVTKLGGEGKDARWKLVTVL